MSRYYDSVHLASDQKDLLISQLKAEIFEIQQRDKDYLALRDQLYQLQQKYRLLQDEKLLQDNDFKGKHDANAMSVHQLKKEIDDLRFLLNEKNRGNNDLQQEIANARDQIQRKDLEINETQRDVAQKGDQGFSIRKDIDNLSYELNKLKDEKCKDQQEIDRLRELGNLKERENADLDQRIRGTDHELFKAQERSNLLSKEADQRDYELRRTAELLDASQAELARLKDDQQRLQTEQSSLQRNLDAQNSQKGDLMQQLDSEQNRQRTLQAQLFDLEAKVRHVEDQLAIARKDQDDLRFSNMGMGDRNNDLRSEIEALQNHCNVLQQQNRDLNIELERFVQTDEQIRATLNRRDRVNDLRHKTENELQKSLYDLERSSPTRSGFKR